MVLVTRAQADGLLKMRDALLGPAAVQQRVAKTEIGAVEAGVKGERGFHLRNRSCECMPEHMHPAEGETGSWVSGIEGNRFLCRPCSPLQACLGVIRQTQSDVNRVGPGQVGIGSGELRIEFAGTLEQLPCFGHSIACRIAK